MGRRTLRDISKVGRNRRMWQLAGNAHWNFDLAVIVGDVNHIMFGAHEFAAERFRHHDLRSEIEVLVEVEPAVAKDRIIGRLRHNIVRDDPRDEFNVAESPADLLLRNLESNYKLAKTRGKSLDGDEELLLRLSDLASESVVGIVFDTGSLHTTLFLRSTTLEPIARVVVRDSK